jgi:glutathione S-transferase
MAVRTTGPIIKLASKLNDATDEHVRAELARLPGLLDQVDRWIEGGVLNGPQLNAADFQLAPSLRLLMTFDDIRPAIESRPAGALAERVQPQQPGTVPPVFPEEWLEPLRQPAVS